jgi:hypothetical protein
VVTFPNPFLDAAIRLALNKSFEPIYASELAGLPSLSAAYGQIEDLSWLKYCTNLTALDLTHNQITDMSPLTSLAKLMYLQIGWAQISDISPLANLTNLTDIDLRNNQISDIGPLVQNEGLGTGDVIRLEGNPLSSDSIGIYLPQLRARGVTFDY